MPKDRPYVLLKNPIAKGAKAPTIKAKAVIIPTDEALKLGDITSNRAA